MIIYLVNLLIKLHPIFGPARVFKYTTFRVAMALLTAFFIAIVMGPWVIRKLRQLKIGQEIRNTTKPGAPNLYDLHGNKQGTPTMGGLIIIGAIVISVILFCNLSVKLILALLSITMLMGLIGFIDDYRKVTRRNHLGLPARIKLVLQIMIGLGLGAFLLFTDLGIDYAHLGIKSNSHICLPFFKNIYPDLGLFLLPFAALVLVASANAVNITDGLDGLATGITILAAMSFAVVTYLVGRVDFARYLMVPYVPGAGEMTIFIGAVVGACFGFLWFNAHPAQIFMGDTGALALGALLGSVALLAKQEFLLLVIGGIFVIEAISVIVQVSSYKLTGKRVFSMAPLHHHFEKNGLLESKIIIRFWIISALLALFGLSILKLR